MSIESTAQVEDGAVATDPSAAPIRARGVRSRAGNAMGRTRAAVIDGAVSAVAAAGARKTTMADIAAHSGIAKGTLYNHFRTKEAVFTAVLGATIDRLADAASATVARDGLAAALGETAAAVADSDALAALRDEPAALLPLVTVGDDGLWAAAREATATVLASAGARSDETAVDLVLRWLTSAAASGAGSVDQAATARLIATAVATPFATPVPQVEPPEF